jgi:hypothetical protein
MRADLARYFQILDAEDYEAASAHFAPDAAYLRPDGMHTEVVRGREAIRAFLPAERGRATGHRLTAMGRSSSGCWAEGVTGLKGFDRERATIVHARLDRDGLISSYLGCLAEKPSGWVDPPFVDTRPLVESRPESVVAYYHGLDTGQLEEAAAAFAEHATFARSAVRDAGYGDLSVIEVLEGRPASLDLLRERDVRVARRHTIVDSTFDGREFWGVGVGGLRDGPDDVTFVVHATIDDAGLIARCFGLGAVTGGLN